MAFAEERINYKVGNGQKISFWNDNWIGGAPLQHQLPDLTTFVFFNRPQLQRWGQDKDGTYT